MEELTLEQALELAERFSGEKRSEQDAIIEEMRIEDADVSRDA